ncbi:hypothetical protein FJTKL_01090 [Diaporthe vaccinii]|uniref:Uncharacterized protein n=1 Tax=Diaporthe vaccinii TaxID=105482 RepID=A0ABR4F4Z6_9PEZI
MAQAHLISREPPHRRLLYIRLRPRALSAPGPSLLLSPPPSHSLSLATTLTLESISFVNQLSTRLRNNSSHNSNPTTYKVTLPSL